MNVYELLVKTLEDAEFDIYNGTDVENVNATRRRALADIHGAKEAEMFSETEEKSWKERIEKVTTFRLASLEWRE